MEQQATQMTAHMQFIINVLIGVIGILIGIGVAHVGILRKLNRVVISVTRDDERITTLFRDDAERKAEMQTIMGLHREMVQTTRELINQNTILIRSGSQKG